MSAPERIWACCQIEHVGNRNNYHHTWDDEPQTLHHEEWDQEPTEYILATPSALAQSPEVQALIQKERERAARIVESLIDRRSMAAAIRAPDAPASADAGRAG